MTFKAVLLMLALCRLRDGQAQAPTTSWPGYSPSYPQQAPQPYSPYQQQETQQPLPSQTATGMYSQQQPPPYSQATYNQPQTQTSAPSFAQSLQLEPQGAVSSPDGSHSGTQLFKGGDSNFYVVDWSYPTSSMIPYSFLLKKYGALQPPEYVAMYRLRGPASGSGAGTQRGSYDPTELIPGNTGDQYLVRTI